LDTIELKSRKPKIHVGLELNQTDGHKYKELNKNPVSWVFNIQHIGRLSKMQ